MKRWIGAVEVLLTMALLGGAGADAARGVPESAASALGDWLDGPVRYLINAQEEKAYRVLESDAERAVFIEKFWQRRDPTPEAPGNEYRQLFWERVQDANARFTDGTGYGWKTDRGKIYILYGPPSRIEDDLFADTKGLPSAGRGLIRWIYEGRPGGRMDLDPVVVIPFVRGLTGEYRLSYDPKLASLTFNVSDLKDPTRMNLDRWLDIVSPPTRSELSVMLDLGRMQEPPVPERVLLSRVDTFEVYGSQRLEVDVARFRTPEGATLVVLTVGLPGGGADTDAPGVLARFAAKHGDGEERVLGQGSFRFEGSGPARIAQGRVVLEPGTWNLTVLSADPLGGSGVYRGAVVVPEERDASLRLSDVVLARELEPLAYRALVSYEEPYLVGAFRVVPRVAEQLHRGEPVTLFYEVYGGQGPYEVTYRVEGKDDDGGWVPLGKAASRQSPATAQGWEIPTSPAWPTGEYRVRIALRDASGAETDAVLPFTLAPEPSPASASGAPPDLSR